MPAYSYDATDRTSYFRDPGVGVVKFGTEVLTGPDGGLEFGTLYRKLGEVVAAHQRGIRMVVVTSGAIAEGLQYAAPGVAPDDLTIVQKQVASSVGQPKLMQLYDDILSKYRSHRLHAMQVLLTSDTFSREDATRDFRDLCEYAFDHNLLPVINANDAISKIEIEESDNDRIAALSSVKISADFLVIYMAGRRNGGTVDYFYDRDPNDPEAQAIKSVYHVTDEVRGFASPRTKSGIITRGGYNSKNAAGEICIEAGIPMIVANERYALNEILDGNDIGTFYVPGNFRQLKPKDNPKSG